MKDADGAKAKGEWLLLFQMDSEGDHILWGDVGVGNWPALTDIETD